jgi:hypothetical protein
MSSQWELGTCLAATNEPSCSSVRPGRNLADLRSRRAVARNPVQDMAHPVQADHISNSSSLEPCEGAGAGGTAVSEQGRRELLELHARVAFRGLRMKRTEVGRCPWDYQG